MARELNKKYGHLFGYWEEKSGTNVDDIEDAFLIYKKFLDRKRQNRTLVNTIKLHIYFSVSFGKFFLLNVHFKGSRMGIGRNQTW